jgi:pSer/pThr/pTyr-binding forkhead associated (FHA) protein
MSAFLLPSSGGDAIPLRKTRVYLGRSKEADPGAPTGRDTALIMLELAAGWWHIEDLRSPSGVRVNGVACKKQKLAPNDEIEIGKLRYRINYETPKYKFGRKSDGEFAAVVVPKGGESSAPRPPANGVLGRLVPLGGGPDHPLRSTRVTVGRKAPAQIVIERSTVSGSHCELELLEGYWFVRDLGSRNGTRIDGEKISEGWVLPNGRLTIGDQRFQLEYTATGPRPIGAIKVRTDRSLLEQAGIDEDSGVGMARWVEADDSSDRERLDLLAELRRDQRSAGRD